MKKYFLTLGLALSVLSIIAQTRQTPWLDAPERSFAKPSAVCRIVPDRYRSLSLDLDLLKNTLRGAPMRFSPQAETAPVLLAIPMPDGTTQEFQVVEAPVMHPDLAARYPYIRSFSGWSRTDGTAYLRCGYTQNGFHAMILSANHSTAYIDLYAEGDDRHYISYFKKDYPNPHHFECLLQTPDAPASAMGGASPAQALVVGDCQHRNYALALACTGEYAAFHGGTKPLVLAQFNVAMTRINGIYERELAVTMTMVANTDLLIYLNANTDPYTNNDGGTMLDQNQNTCNMVIGNANYDIGHVFSTGGGGVAQLNAVCNNSGKARGVTGLGSPIGDPFLVDYVAHEMGHQFGGNHTQNNDCNRSGNAAMEPGSASTIMGYAGICSPDVQPHSDDYFHAHNLGEMHNHLLGGGNSCATTTITSNSAPSVTATASSYNLPVSTPFVLTAQATDANTSDVLTYCWEQMNNQVATMPPLPTNTGGPAFRSIDPATSPSRYFPNLGAVLAGTTPTWEVLPSVTRTMAFRCTVRDNHPGAGCTDEVNVSLNFSASAGPFVVTNPNTSAVVWTGGNNANVTWNVANTNLPPVATSQVEILLSADGGNTYPYTLLSTTNNDGTESILVPNIATTQARVMVKAKGNVYFDISNQNFTIQMAVVPGFLLQATPDTAFACQSGQAAYTFDMEQLAGFDQPVAFTASGLPAGATATFTPNNAAPPASVGLTIGDLGSAAAGTYPVTITATGGAVTKASNIVLIVLDQVTATATLSSPADGAEVTFSQPTLTWAPVPNAAEYYVEVSTSPGFGGAVIASGTVTTNSYQVPTALNALTVYYWRVRAANPCSQSSFSAINAFHVGNIGCQIFTATGLPLTIPNVETTVTKTLNVSVSQSILSVKTTMSIDHSYVGDLDVELVSPQNTARVVFDRPGVPASDFGCTGDDISASFSDSYTNTAMIFENTCDGSTPTIGGNYQPVEAFSNFVGQNSQGNWTLRVTDNYDDDGGALLTWSLEICGLIPSTAAILLNNDLFSVLQGQDEIVTPTYLQGQGSPSDEVIFTLLSLPANGTLQLNGSLLAVGGTFTQADIDAGVLSYQHDGSATGTDEFLFDFVDNVGSWLHSQVFHIHVIQSSLTATIDITQPVTCAGGSNGEVAVFANGGTTPLSYSLNGASFQSDYIFSNLSAGSYTVEVMDSIGFIFTTSTVVLSDPSAIIATAAVNNDDITVTVSGSTGNLQYSLNGGAFQNSNAFYNLPNATYTITVMDANGCTATTTATLNALTASASVTEAISCFGENEGVITVIAGNGVPPYLYSLNGGAPQTSHVFANLAAGSYSVEVQDANGFPRTISNIIVDAPVQLTVTASASLGTITVNASGGTGNLQYSLNGSAFQISNVFENLTSGSYDVVVQDANGCTATTTAFVNNIVVSGTVTGSINCFGGTEGQITATASGGGDPYQYSLNGGAFQNSGIFSNLVAGNYTITTMDADGLTQTSPVVVLAAPPQITGAATANGYTVTATVSGGTGSLQYSFDGGAFQDDNTFYPVANGDHTVTVRDANGCEATFSVTVAVQALAVAGDVSQSISCPSSTDGQITAVGTGGVPTYQYSLNGGAFQASSVFSDLAAGNYTLTIMDSGGFMSSSTITLTAPPALVVNPSAAFSVVTVVVGGGTAPYQYQLDNGPLQSSNSFSGVANGTHIITVVDANGCTQTTSVLVGGLPPNIFASNSQPVSCHGIADAVITVNASGGTSPYTYSLNGGPFQSGNTFFGLSAGTYSVTVMGADGGTTTAPDIIINDPPVLSVAATATGLTITANGSGGTGDYEYSFSGTNFSNANELEVSGNGTYTVIVRDEHGCTASVTVTVNAVTATNVTVESVSCHGETDGQIIIAGVTGGTPPYQYSLNGGAFSSQTTYSNLAPGNYTLTVKDATGYEFEASIIVIAEPSPLAANFQLTLNNLVVVASGGTGQLTYSVDGGTTFQTSNTFNDLPLGTYQVVVMDENGCTFEGQVIVDMTATKDRLDNLVFEVLPNPSDGLFILKMDLPNFVSLKLAVFDVVGRQVFASQLEATGPVQQPLDLRGLASGTYLLRVSDDENWGAKKLVIFEK